MEGKPQEVGPATRILVGRVGEREGEEEGIDMYGGRGSTWRREERRPGYREASRVVGLRGTFCCGQT